MTDYSSDFNDDRPTAEDLLRKLEEVYSARNLQSEFQQEREIYLTLINMALTKLSAFYILKRPFQLGSTATIWVVFEPHLKARRALKLARPRLGKVADIVRVLRAESAKLSALNHQNIIRIYAAGLLEMTDEYSFPYYIMDYMDNVVDFHDYFKYLERNSTPPFKINILSCIHGILSGMQYLHDSDVIHCDLKPANILVTPKGHGIIADLGYAKHFEKPRPLDSKLTEITFTREFAHPDLRTKITQQSDPNATIAQIDRMELRPAFDFFAMGRTLLYVLDKLHADETGRINRCTTIPLSNYQWQYLAIIAKRLLDGVVEKQDPNDLHSDVISGLSSRVMKELRYENAGDAVIDIEKLMQLYDLEREVPELNTNINSYVQIPHCQVPLTSRVSKVINHPTFARLGRVTQLGFVSLLYPGAVHTRFEHVLGTFSHCCAYIRSLWYDSANCLFQSVMQREDIEQCLAAALLHDIAQYPMAHDLTEICDNFQHEQLTLGALCRLTQECDESLADVLYTEWGVNVEDVLKIMQITSRSQFKHRLLNSIISGPLDCDKLDYLKRDSTHLGVSYGASLDDQRLLRNLTVVYRSQGSRTPLAELGVTEKALVIAKAFWMARKDMFAQVYWHHTVRSLKAMLGFVVRNILLRMESTDGATKFWSEFHNRVVYLDFNGLLPSSKTIDTDDDLGNALSSAERGNGIEWTPECQLGLSDDCLLGFLWQYAEEKERSIIHNIRSRRLYQRVAVVSGARRKTPFLQIYNELRTYRLNNNLRMIEQFREQAEGAILNRLIDKLRTDSRSAGLYGTPDSMQELFLLHSPVILVDVPIKATSKEVKEDTLRYLPEDFTGVKGRSSRATSVSLKFLKSTVNRQQVSFDTRVGKIRIFVKPELKQAILGCLSSKTIVACLL